MLLLATRLLRMMARDQCRGNAKQFRKWRMKKLGRILLLSVVVLVMVAAVAVHFTIGWRPLMGPRRRAATNRKYERTPERRARGEYLVNRCWVVETATRRATGPNLADPTLKV
jgi:hypothetical protein